MHETISQGSDVVNRFPGVRHLPMAFQLFELQLFIAHGISVFAVFVQQLLGLVFEGVH
jgi:hypothetical protein